MLYHKEGASGKLIHQLKYENKPYIGAWLAGYLAPKIQSDPPDIIIPIPLHPRKLKQRGYNQLEKFGKKLAEETGASYRDDILIKHLYTPSQTTKNPLERWRNVRKTFSVKCPKDLKGKHILLIDDVLTTGATLSAAGDLLAEKCPDIRISVATMAFNWH